MTIKPKALSAAACRDARTLLDLTQEELASAASISVSTVRRCERGEPVSEYARKQILSALEARGATFMGARALEKLGASSAQNDNAIYVQLTVTRAIY